MAIAPAIPADMIDRWRSDARAVLADASASPSLRRLAWAFLSRWRLAGQQAAPGKHA